jgi:hypothetical protein
MLEHALAMLDLLPAQTPRICPVEPGSVTFQAVGVAPPPGQQLKADNHETNSISAM